MKKHVFILVLAFLSVTCRAAPPSYGSSALAALRRAVFGTKEAEDAFVDRVATTAQSVFSVLRNPVVVRELRNFYFKLLRNPTLRNTLGGGSAAATTNLTLPSATVNAVSSRIRQSAANFSLHRNDSALAGNASTVEKVGVGTPGVKYEYYFDQRHVSQRPRRSIHGGHYNDLRPHHVMHWNVQESCLTVTVCGLPLNFLDFKRAKIRRFFR